METPKVEDENGCCTQAGLVELHGLGLRVSARCGRVRLQRRVLNQPV